MLDFKSSQRYRIMAFDHDSFAFTDVKLDQVTLDGAGVLHVGINSVCSGQWF